jgi:5,10-methylenetetrahydrofolate reductase
VVTDIVESLQRGEKVVADGGQFVVTPQGLTNNDQIIKFQTRVRHETGR